MTFVALRRSLAAVCCVSLLGCPADDGGSNETSGATSSGSSSSTSTSSTSSTSSTGSEGTSESGPPVTCDAPVMFSDPQCDPCAAEACCAQLEACFGDGTTAEAPACAQLSVCLEDNCADVSDEEFDACVQDNCGDTADQLDALIAVFDCVSSCIVVSPGNEETCGIVPA